MSKRPTIRPTIRPVLNASPHPLLKDQLVVNGVCVSHFSYSTDILDPDEPHGTVYCYSCGRYCPKSEYEAWVAEQQARNRARYVSN